MMYLLIVITILLAAVIVLLVMDINTGKKKSSSTLDEALVLNMKEQLRLALLSDFERLSREMQNSSQKASEQAYRLKNDVNESLLRIDRNNREEIKTVFNQVSQMSEKESQQLRQIEHVMTENLEKIRISNRESLGEISKETEKLTKQIQLDMDRIRQENNLKLDQMRATVDEKLQKTLDEKISQSFKNVTDNLQKLYESLGSLNNLTSDVQNINRIFSNVKSRGVWGEVQAENILEDILTSEQYVRNYSPKNNRENVEFAIKLPARNGTDAVYLPVDSKFPVTDYIRYKEALDEHDEAKINESLKCVKDRLLQEAKDIYKKYIVPPDTTDFAILFVPAESIYIELLRLPEFVDKLQTEMRVILTGPNNFAALLNSLRLGFKTLQIEKYTSQIWHGFETLKKYFADLSKAIDDSKKAVEKASEHLDGASRKKEKLSSVILEMESSAEKGYLGSTKDTEDAKFIENTNIYTENSQ